MRRARAVVRWCGWLLGVTLVAGACSDTASEERKLARLSDKCSINNDCKSPLVCAFQRCHVECEDSRDCEQPQRCVVSDRPFHVCQLSDERECVYTSECPKGQVCANDGQCRDQCSTERDCVTGQLCVSGSCADPGELSDGGLPNTNPTDGGGTPCTFNSDCPAPQLCRAGLCLPECREDRDCPAGATCQAGGCVTATADAGPICTYASDCAAGQICAAGHCRCECRTSADCAAGSVCDGCGCQPDLPDGAPPGYGTECTLPSDCTGGLVCRLGKCAYQCNVTSDCSVAGSCCVTHRCIVGPACNDGGAEAGPPDAAPDGCTACISNSDCNDHVWCNGYEQCSQGCCHPGPEPCNSSSACVTDTCNEQAETCEHLVQSPVDSDGDGQLDEKCGPTGYDCDDTDPSVYLGAPERCDNKDNDCNGQIDDRSHRPYGAVFSAALAQSVGAEVAPLGSGYVAVWGTNTATFVQGFDAQGAPAGTPVQIVARPLAAVEVAAGGGKVLALLRTTISGGWAMDYALIGGSPAAPTVDRFATLSPGGGNNYNLSAAWSGSDFAVAWTSDATGEHARIGRVALDGTLSGVAAVTSGDGLGGSNYSLRVAAVGPVTATAFRDTTNNYTTISLQSAGGAALAGPTVIQSNPSTDPREIASTANGFIAMTPTLELSFWDLTGAVGTRHAPQGWAPLDGIDAAGTNQGAYYVLLTAGTARVVYIPGDLSGHVLETYDAIPRVATNTGGYSVGIAGSDARFVVSSFSSSEATVRWVQVGCAP